MSHSGRRGNYFDWDEARQRPNFVYVRRTLCWLSRTTERCGLQAIPHRDTSPNRFSQKAMGPEKSARSGKWGRACRNRPRVRAIAYRLRSSSFDGVSGHVVVDVVVHWPATLQSAACAVSVLRRGFEVSAMMLRPYRCLRITLDECALSRQTRSGCLYGRSGRRLAARN